jgi:hypothetical protein
MESLRDKQRRAEPHPLAREVFTTERDGVQLSMEVDPCSWMYPGHGTQVCVTLAGSGSTHFRPSRDGKVIRWPDLSRQDLENALESVRVTACVRCGGPTFEAGFQGPDWKGMCERCGLSEMRSALDRLDAARQRAQKRMDAVAWHRGARWRVFGFVHPKRGGDDYPFLHYLSCRPTEQEVRALFSRAGSAVTDDYSLTELQEPGALARVAQDFVDVAVGCKDADSIHSIALVLGGRRIAGPRTGVRAYRFNDDGSHAQVELRSLEVSLMPSVARSG